VAELCTYIESGQFPVAAGGRGFQSGAYIATDAGLLFADTCQTIASSVPLASGLGPTVIPGTPDVVVVGHGNLVNFDTSAMQVKWSLSSHDIRRVRWKPGNRCSTLYVQNCGQLQLEARNEADGVLLWSWQPPASDDRSFVRNVVATDNLVFVSTSPAFMR